MLCQSLEIFIRNRNYNFKRDKIIMKYTRQRRHSSGGRWTDVSYSCVLFWMEEEGNHFQTDVYVYLLDQVDLNNIFIAYIIQLFLMYYNVLQFDVQRTTPSPSYLPPSII